MTTLIERLSKMDGPDREVDALIECEAGDEYSFGHRLGKNKGSVIAYFNRSNGDIGHGTYKAPAYTASVDAAIALAERVLRGWTGFLDFGGTAKTFVADIMSDARSKQTREDEEEFGIDLAQEAHGEGATPAIALCIAILRAKEASNG